VQVTLEFQMGLRRGREDYGCLCTEKPMVRAFKRGESLCTYWNELE
jgi:hypothetical protein